MNQLINFVPIINNLTGSPNMHASNVLFWFAIIMLIAAAYLYAKKEGLNDDKNAIALSELLGRVERLETTTALSRTELGVLVARMDEVATGLRQDLAKSEDEARAAGNVLAKNLSQKIEWIEVKIKALKHASNSAKKQVEISLDPMTLDKILKKPGKKK